MGLKERTADGAELRRGEVFLEIKLLFAGGEDKLIAAV